MYLYQVFFYFNDEGITNLRVRTKNTTEGFKSRIDIVEKRINYLESSSEQNI